MYKVFINDKVICFTNSKETVQKYPGNKLVLCFFYESLVDVLVNLLEDTEKNDAVMIKVEDVDKAFGLFKKRFTLIYAAGGLVENDRNEFLFIHRLGKWDLPKGKMEAGEDRKQTAVREVEEECGVEALKINSRLDDTFHLYRWKGKMVLKQTFWYTMSTNYKGKLIPQMEEGIVRVEWLTPKFISKEVMPETYASIKGLLVSTSRF